MRLGIQVTYMFTGMLSCYITKGFMLSPNISDRSENCSAGQTAYPGQAEHMLEPTASRTAALIYPRSARPTERFPWVLCCRKHPPPPGAPF